MKEKLKKTWNFIWNDDSIWSWILSLILAFIIVKFIFFPLLSFSLSTQLPLVVVESSSMHHPGSLVGNAIGTQDSFQLWWSQAKDWYQSRNITEEDAESWPLRTGMEKGDIIVVYGRGEPEPGDIIIFNADTQHPIIHRIISKKMVNGKIVYSTKGDSNSGQLDIEKEIPDDALVGKAVFRIPKLGWVKLVFVELYKGFAGS